MNKTVSHSLCSNGNIRQKKEIDNMSDGDKCYGEKEQGKGQKEYQAWNFPNLSRMVRESLRDLKGRRKQDMKVSGESGF